ncbi:ISAs1 family transposase [Salmonella enterica]|uniref:ISAs1 family transposase n=1 Tax=Salmonella enterica TaxID=28901 RepID=UPI00217DA745|nr:ISAs1 family transposase [Salmonella enterica]
MKMVEEIMRCRLFCKEIASQDKEPEMQVRYYISSASLTAEKFARSIRERLFIENCLYWCLDTTMNEDDYRLRRENAAELFAVIRHIAVIILRQEMAARWNCGAR